MGGRAAERVRTAARKRHGIHYTPPDLAAFLARRAVRALGTPRPGVRVLDPACGDGELLVAAAAGVSPVSSRATSSTSPHGPVRTT